MSVYYLLVLIGLMVEIIACFILSVDAIGLERVSNWASWLSLFKKDVFEEKDVAPFFSRRSQVPRIIWGIGGASGVLLGKLSADKFFGGFENAKWYYSFLSGLIGGCVGMALYFGLIYGLSVSVFALHRLEKRTRERSAGIIGFLLLFLGFILQFVGTLGQGLSK